MQETGSKADETGDIIDELMTNAPDTEIVLLLKEKDDGTLSGSLRTISEAVDASEIASFWGGGGHPKAAGFRLEKTDFASGGQAIVDRIKEYQSRRLNLQPAEPDSPANETPAIPAAPATAEPSRNNTPDDSASPYVRAASAEPRATGGSDSGSGRRQIEPGVLYKFEAD